MIRLSFFAALFSVVAAPAFAHEGAGVVHYLTQADHVAGLISAIALPAIFWIVLRATAPKAQERKVRIQKD